MASVLSIRNSAAADARPTAFFKEPESLARPMLYLHTETSNATTIVRLFMRPGRGVARQLRDEMTTIS